MLSPRQAADVLGTSDRPTSRQLRAAYRAAVRAAHPDLGGDTERLLLVRSAHRVLAGRVADAADDPTPELSDGAHEPADHRSARVAARYVEGPTVPATPPLARPRRTRDRPTPSFAARLQGEVRRQSRVARALGLG